MKIRLLLALVGFAIGFVLPGFAQNQNAVDPEVRQQIEALLVKGDEASPRELILEGYAMGQSLCCANVRRCNASILVTSNFFRIGPLHDTE